MPLLENKKYVLCKIDSKKYCIVNGQFNRYLASINLSLPQYLEDHEGIRCRCLYCNSYAGVKAGFIPKHTCGNHKCAKAARKAGFTEEVKRNITAVGKALFANKEWAQVQQQKMHAGNQIINADGLTGYERTKLKREQTLLKKYGHAQYANWEKTKNTWESKTDEEKDFYARKTSERLMHISPGKRRQIQSKIAETNLKKFGTICPANKGSRGFSKVSAKLFDALDTNGIFKPKWPREIMINRMSVDFCLDTKIIEFYGDYWHANPSTYLPEHLISRKNALAKTIWQKDAERIKKIEAAGYQVKIVWEKDFKRHPEKVIEECKTWLSSI